MPHVKKCLSVEQAFSVAAAHAEMGVKCKLYKQDGTWWVELPFTPASTSVYVH